MTCHESRFSFFDVEWSFYNYTRLHGRFAWKFCFHGNMNPFSSNYLNNMCILLCNLYILFSNIPTKHNRSGTLNRTLSVISDTFNPSLLFVFFTLMSSLSLASLIGWGSHLYFCAWIEVMAFEISELENDPCTYKFPSSANLRPLPHYLLRNTVQDCTAAQGHHTIEYILSHNFSSLKIYSHLLSHL